MTHAINLQMAIGRRAWSKVSVQVVGSTSVGWVEALEAWGADLEAIVVDTPEKFKDIRLLLSIMPTTTPQAAHAMLPLGPWDGCMVANLRTPWDSELASSLFKRWHHAIVILLIHSSILRTYTISMLPSGLPIFYCKKTFTVHHHAIRGVTSASWRFAHYTRWTNALSYPLIMTSENLSCVFQMALSDTVGGEEGGYLQTTRRVGPSRGHWCYIVLFFLGTAKPCLLW
jgi:hypothetical protein